MKLTQFLKPDSKRIIVLLVMLIPLIKFIFYPSAQFPAQFHLWDAHINVWGYGLNDPIYNRFHDFIWGL